jgi:hypothetical protein
MASTATHLPEKCEDAALVESKASEIAKIIQSGRNVTIFTGEYCMLPSDTSDGNT